MRVLIESYQSPFLVFKLSLVLRVSLYSLRFYLCLSLRATENCVMPLVPFILFIFLLLLFLITLSLTSTPLSLPVIL